MKKVEIYLKEYIDEKAEIKECTQNYTKNVPLMLGTAFEWYELTIMGEKSLMLKPVQKETAYRLKKWTEQIEKICGINTVLLMEEATPYMVKRMISDRMAFVIPGKQVNLPFLIMMIKTEKKSGHKSTIKFSPSTQLIFLFILYSKSNKFTIEEIERELNISKMSAQRGLSELKELGLLSYQTTGKTGRKKVFEIAERKDYYEKGKEYLDNPVRETIYVKDIPKEAGGVIGNLSALAQQTMLGDPSQKNYALWNKYKSRLDEHIVTEEQALEEGLPVVQLMKYDVKKISRNQFVDPITLILGLSAKDERIEMSVDELMKEYDWYEREGRLMVKGIEKFKEYFSGYSGQYVFIGGTACDIILGSKDIDFRVTKDLDIVLVMEALDENFVIQFISFIKDGGYKHIKKGTTENQFYRFESPKDRSFPAMIELFSKKPDYLNAIEQKLGPIYVSNEVISLSAILLDKEYYALIQRGMITLEGMTVLDIEYLILFKMKAWVDLTMRKDSGEKIDSRDIKKHKNDVIRLASVMNPNKTISVNEEIKSDIRKYLEGMEVAPVDMKSLGLGRISYEEIAERIRKCFGL